MKKEYQQIVKARILKYKKGDQLAQIDENAGMRHKSLNVREQYHNTIGRKSTIANMDPSASMGKQLQIVLREDVHSSTTDETNHGSLKVNHDSKQTKSVDRAQKNGVLNKLS